MLKFWSAVLALPMVWFFARNGDVSGQLPGRSVWALPPPVAMMTYLYTDMLVKSCWVAATLPSTS